jgi:competence protein ComEC
VLVDCPAGKASTVMQYLDRHHINTLELVLVTHSDDDHFGGIPTLVKNFPGVIKRLWFLPDRPTATPTYALRVRELANHVKRDRPETMAHLPVRGDFCNLDAVEIDVLHPDVPSHALNLIGDLTRNNTGVVIKARCRSRKVLFGADVQGKGWEDITRSCDVTADVFRVPHHGDWYSGAPSLGTVIEVVRPQIGVISAGKNRHGHPEPETIRALREVNARVACTQATTRCHSDFAQLRESVRSLLHAVNPGDVELPDSESCPCAGTVEVLIHGSGELTFLPAPHVHDRIVESFDDAMCLAKGRHQYLTVEPRPSDDH